jgi:hypothetical protein
MRRATAVSLLLGSTLAAVDITEPPRPQLDRTAVAALLASDPQQARTLGRELFRRQFTPREGAGAARRTTMRAAQAQSCIVCHNVPYGEAGAGATIGLSGPSGRNTPHLFGAGQLERLSLVLSDLLVAQVDRNHDGTISLDEAAGQRALIDPDGAGPEPAIDFGTYLASGQPALDPAIRIWFVAADGHRLPAAGTWSDPGVAGLRLRHGPFGWSAADGEDPRATASLRSFIVGAFAAHAGLEADDPTLAEEAASGLAAREPDGTRPLFMGGLPDPGIRRDAAGHSLDDPDGDGVAAELSTGDVDLVAAYLRGLPAPSERRAARGFATGRDTFTRIGCTSCHVPDWHLSGISVTGLYSDLRHHDLGPACHQVRFDGGVTTRFRTPPLWGVGSTAPYGHDGASLDLDAVIRRHGGEAQVATAAYVALPDADQEAVLAFLRALELPPPAP